MPKELSQADIDALLGPAMGLDCVGCGKCGFQSLEQFHNYLVDRPFRQEEPYGIFEDDTSVLRFRADRKGDEVLADIRARNQADGAGNVRIPGTDIELINYSYCPTCERVFSFQDLKHYYLKPKPVPGMDRLTQLRRDTRVCCSSCDTYFLPALILCDGTPRQETQLLCRVQTVEAVEAWCQGKGKTVLTRRAANRVRSRQGREAVLNDVRIKDLRPRPTLIVNLLQYTPPDLMMSFIECKNVAKRDVLFGEWVSRN